MVVALTRAAFSKELGITGWTRLESGNWGEHMALGLEARLCDPLWLLARQWQMGEFRGINAGSPVRAELELEHSEVDRFHAGGKGAGEAYHIRAMPLDVLVEREALLAGTEREDQLPVALEAGRYFLELLREAGLAHVCEAVIHPCSRSTAVPSGPRTVFDCDFLEEGPNVPFLNPTTVQLQ